MAIEIKSIHERRPQRHNIKRVRHAMRRGAHAASLRKRQLIFRTALAFTIIALAATTAFLIYSYISYSKIVDARLASGYLTSRAGIYAAPRTLRAGQALSRDELVALLRRAGYIEGAQGDASDVWSGNFTAQVGSVQICPRHVHGTSVPSIIQVNFDKRDRISNLTGDELTLDSFKLEPEVLTADATMKAGEHVALAYKDIPPVLAHAILSIEDHRFFEHGGVDFYGIARAFLRNAGEDHYGQGGSTITQQLVKNTYLSPEKTYRRKFAEAMLSFTLERRLSKQDIFALYCNEVYLGQRGAVAVRGVEHAARIFFAKELKDLTLSESATLAGLIQSPSRYAPDRHSDAATARRNTVLAAMLRDGAIDTNAATAATNEPLNIAPAPETNESLAPYFVDYVNRATEAKLETDNAEQVGGEQGVRAPRVFTTIDLDLQQLAEAAIRNQLARLDKIYKNKGVTPQAALVALDPRTGNVLAMVGGRDYAESQLNRATDARRQPGSIFKPFVYAAALESGISPTTMLTDAPRGFIYDSRTPYRPANYGNTYSMRDVPMRTGLVKSLNVVTVDVAMRTGLSRIATLAESFGLTKPAPYPSLALGTTEVTPLSIAAAYATFANGGKRVEPKMIAHAADATGEEIMGSLSAISESPNVIQPTTAYMVTDMLYDVIDHGTAHAARGAVKRTAIAGKTGTSRDGWFVGYTPNLVCVVWIGFDDNKQLGLTGAEAALPAWTEFVKGAVELRPELGGEAFIRPEGIKTVEIDSETGLLASDTCPQRETIAIISELAPTTTCFTHRPLLDLTASTDSIQLIDSSALTNAEVINAARNGAQASTATASSLSSHTLTNVEAANASAIHATRVENVRGRNTLVNDMRFNATQTQP
jgi:penicillin-binding protein 1B